MCGSVNNAGGIFHKAKVNVIPASRQQSSRLQQLRDAVIDFCAAYSATVTHNPVQWVRTATKIAPLL